MRQLDRCEEDSSSLPDGIADVNAGTDCWRDDSIRAAWIGSVVDRHINLGCPFDHRRAVQLRAGRPPGDAYHECPVVGGDHDAPNGGWPPDGYDPGAGNDVGMPWQKFPSRLDDRGIRRLIGTR